MKTAVSVPDDIFREADELARRRRLTRSALYTAALKAFVRQHRPSDITRALNEVYEHQNDGLDAAIASMQSMSLPKGHW